MLRAWNFEWSSTWENTFILDCICNCTKSITNSISCLSNRIIVWSLNKNCAGERIINTFNESIFVFTEHLLINNSSKSKVSLSDIINWIKHLTTASKRNTFTISLFGTTDSNNSSSGEYFKWGWINTFLINNNKVLVGTFAKFFFELNNLTNFVIGKSAFTCN